MNKTDTGINTYMYDSIPIPASIWTADYRVIDCNNEMVRFLGMPDKATAIERFYEFSVDVQPCGTPSKEKAERIIDKVISTNEIIKHRWNHLVNGEIIPVEVTVMRVPMGEEYVCSCYAQDLRDSFRSKEVEDALLQREFELELHKQLNEANEWNQAFIDSSPYIISTWSKDKKITSASKAAMERFGISDPKVFVERFTDFSPEFQPCGTPSAKLAIKYMEQALREGTVQFEWMHVSSAGEELPSEIIGKRFVRGGEDLIVLFNRDLREVKMLEKQRLDAIEEATERIRLMVEATPIMIEFWNENCEALDCNKATLDFFGFTNKQDYLDYVHLSASESRTSEQALHRLNWNNNILTIFNNGSGKFEFVEPDLNGGFAILEVDGIRTKHLDKNVVITYSKDVTKLKEAIENQKRIEIAEESNRAKSAFLARMSHEIRTPITAVMGISEIELKSPDLPVKMEESFAKIYNSAHSLLSIVNDILDLSKIEAGKLSLVSGKYKVSHMIIDILQIHFAFTGSKEIKFNIKVDENLPTQLFGDSLKIIQIANNVLSNAFKYTLKGAIDLSFTCKYNNDGNNMELILVVRDSGLGMNKEQLKDLSSVYNRYHEQDYRYVEGTGLGMSIVFSLVKLMNADIKIESEVGAGTTVVISIPQKCVDDEILGKETAARLEKLEEATKIISKKLSFEPEFMPYGKVLVVDDVEGNLYVAKGLLAFYGVQIETCNNGYAAINKIKRGCEYDVIFMDYMMPGINGTETMHEIRALGYIHPIVALSANAMIGQAEEFIKEGFDSFISKPIVAAQLNSIMIKYVRDNQPSEVKQAAMQTLKQTKPKGDINTFRHNPELISNLRLEFKQSYLTVINRINEALAFNDIETAHRLVHTIKGAAGLIYEHDLEAIAKEVELTFINKTTPAKVQLSALEHEINHVFQKIGDTGTKDNPSTDVMETKEAVSLLEQVIPLLKSKNTKCITMLDELYRIPQSNDLVRQVETFQFGDAAETAALLLQNLRGELSEQNK